MLLELRRGKSNNAQVTSYLDE